MRKLWEFPGVPLVRTLPFHCRGHGFSPWSGNWDPELTAWFSSVTQLCLTLCDLMDCSMPGFPVYNQLPELTQTHNPSSRWWHPTISSSVPFSCLQSFPASGSFPVSQFFASGSWNIGASASASALKMNNQDWFPLGLTGVISLQSKGLSRIFNTTVQKHQFFSVQLSL